MTLCSLEPLGGLVTVGVWPRFAVTCRVGELVFFAGVVAFIGVGGFLTVLGTCGSPCLTTVGFFNVVDVGDDFEGSFPVPKSGPDPLAEVEPDFEPLPISFREAALLNERCEVIDIGDSDFEDCGAGAWKLRRAIDPHSGHLALNLAIAEKL